MKHPSLVLLLALIGATVLHSNSNTVEALPLTRFLSTATRTSSRQPIIPAPMPAIAQEIKNTPVSTTTYAGRAQPRSAASIPKHRRASEKINQILSRQAVAKAEASEATLANINNNNNNSIKHQNNRRRVLFHQGQGHAVLDEEDDDDGNELLDTEMEGLIRPDDDDTIEGEILVEEEDDEEEDDEEDSVSMLLSLGLDAEGSSVLSRRSSKRNRKMAEDDNETLERIIATARFVNPRLTTAPSRTRVVRGLNENN